MMDIALGSDRQKANTSSDNAIVYTPSGALVMGSHHETVDPQPELVNQLMTQWAAEFDHMDDFYGQLAKAALDNADQKKPDGQGHARCKPHEGGAAAQSQALQSLPALCIMYIRA